MSTKVLLDDFIQRLKDAVDKNTKPCLRCEKDTHGTAECTEDYDNCWVNIPSAAVQSRVAKKIADINDLITRKDAGESLHKNQEAKIGRKKQTVEEHQGLEQAKRADAEKHFEDFKQSPGPSPSKDVTPAPSNDTTPPVSIDKVNTGNTKEANNATKRADNSKTPTASKPRTPIATEDLGKIEKRGTQDACQEPALPPTGVAAIKGENRKTRAKRNGIDVLTNHIEIKEIPDTLYFYSVSFWGVGPQGTRITYDRRKEIVRAYEAMIKANSLGRLVNNVSWATDYKNLYTQTRLPGEDSACKIHIPSFPYVDMTGHEVQVMAEFTYLSTQNNIRANIRTVGSGHRTDLEGALNAFIVQRVRSLRDKDDDAPIVTQVSANKFFRNRAFKDMVDRNGQPIGLRAVRGYYTSVRPGEKSLLLNVNRTTTAFLAPVTVAEFFRQVKNQALAEKMLKGKTVWISYRRQDTKEGIADNFDINRDEAREKTFRNIGYGSSVQRFYPLDLINPQNSRSAKRARVGHPGTTVHDYLINNARVNDAATLNQPYDQMCINVGKRPVEHNESLVGNRRDQHMRSQCENGAVWIPACLLQIVPNQPLGMQLDGDSQLPAMGAHSILLPGRNVHYIEGEAIGALLYTRDTEKFWTPNNFKIDPNLITLTAKKLLLPRLYFQKGDRPLQDSRASWSLGIPDVIFAGGKRNVQRLDAFALSGTLRQDQLRNLRQSLADRAGNHGLTVLGGTSYGPDVLSRNLNLRLGQLTRHDCILFVLNKDNQRRDNYAEIKRAADMVYGRHTLCALAGTVKKDDQQTWSNLCLKIAMKQGVASHHLDDKLLQKYMGGTSGRDTTLVLGADVTHPGAGAKWGSPSIACVVGSVDNRFMNYPGSMRLQAGGQELIRKTHLISMVEERIRAWQEFNPRKQLTSILFYRDGISESQFDACRDIEIEAVRQAFDNVHSNLRLSKQQPQVKITFVLATKRHHTRFYACRPTDTYLSKDPDDPRKYPLPHNGNLKAGMVIDDVVTAPGGTNFYLQSHIAIKGTARPAHYYVLTDEMGLGDQLQDLTLMLCYAFPRSTTGVSYVSPAYIADRLCERGRVYLRRWANNDNMAPSWPMPTDATTGRPLRDEALINWKEARADDIANYQNPQGTGDNPWMVNPHTSPGWLNPWHPDLKDTMFWM